MRFVLFYHSLLSDWNHGNAHFLRGVVKELARRGHDVVVLEPARGWSRANLLEHQGEQALADIDAALGLSRHAHVYDEASLDLDHWLHDADIAIVHEWNSHRLVENVGRYRATHPHLRLFFHDTHHRAVSQPADLALYDLRHYDGALVFGEALRTVYEDLDKVEPVWTWHEAADAAWFYPRKPTSRSRRDVIWIGNWGDEERSQEIRDFLLRPARDEALSGTVHGVRYPPPALRDLQRSGLEYRDWLPNHQAPAAYAEHLFTVHIPRRYYVSHLPGIPTIRVFEALACGIPLLSAPWDDAENLFSVGNDFLMASDPSSMATAMRSLKHDPALRQHLADHGRRTILERHTCGHRVDQLLEICREMLPVTPTATAPVA